MIKAPHIPDVFYFARHGQTQANLEGRMSGGGIDIELNATGKEQAQALVDKLVLAKIELSSICVSPLKRAQQTAQRVHDVYSVPIFIIEEFREWLMGDWEGVSFELVKEAFLGDGEPPNGESRLQFTSRVSAALHKLAAHPSPTLVVGHGAVGLKIQKILDIPPIRIENAQPLRFYKSTTGWKREKI